MLENKQIRMFLNIEVINFEAMMIEMSDSSRNQDLNSKSIEDNRREEGG